MMNSTRNSRRHEKIDTIRMKDIVSQLTDVIYLLCNAKGNNISIILDQFTNITKEEQESLNLFFSQDTNH